MGSGIMARAFIQAYRQALANASKNGIAQEAMSNIRRGTKTMTEKEARQILGVTEQSSWEEILKVNKVTDIIFLLTLYLISIEQKNVLRQFNKRHMVRIEFLESLSCNIH